MFSAVAVDYSGLSLAASFTVCALGTTSTVVWLQDTETTVSWITRSHILWIWNIKEKNIQTGLINASSPVIIHTAVAVAIARGGNPGRRLLSFQTLAMSLTAVECSSSIENFIECTICRLHTQINFRSSSQLHAGSNSTDSCDNRCEM